MQTPVTCENIALLLQADIDGELDAAQAATVVQHLAHCEQCTQLQDRLLHLRTALHRDIERPQPSAEFITALRTRLQAAASAHENSGHEHSAQQENIREKNIRDKKPPSRWRSLATFGAGAALAASLLLVLRPAVDSGLEDIVVSEHVRSLQGDHLYDVVSTDRHTVKPWFNGRLDFVPPVNDFVAEGFPLAGARLEYFAGRTVAALVYHRRKHPINVFIWPAGHADDNTPNNCSTNAGYHLCTWRKEGMVFWAISDLNEAELRQFGELWKRAG